MTLRVLLVEDDSALCRTLRDAMTAEGYQVFTAASLSESFALLTGLGAGVAAGCAPVDLVLLDLGLPDGDGIQLLTALRQKHTVPLIVISARESDGQKVRLLDAGADDYLVKPFGTGELLARVRAQLRRHPRASADAPSLLEFGDVRIDLVRRSVERAGAALHLTPIEYRLLTHLASHPNRVLTHPQLLKAVWGPSHSEDTHYVRIYMGHLRAKLEADPSQPQHLVTELGVGYRFVP